MQLANARTESPPNLAAILTLYYIYRGTERRSHSMASVYGYSVYTCKRMSSNGIAAFAVVKIGQTCYVEKASRPRAASGKMTTDTNRVSTDHTDANLLSRKFSSALTVPIRDQYVSDRLKHILPKSTGCHA
ncbi:hypothetical protein M514_06040 [Trichuris suis]|uniref:Uncharacterized protein n=1 Tax=Trichuris suis TaxID=68888 RepID=A0A085M7D0_9BILA|nr:hypothetical protein M513_06040 [Trichuris suis]KFD70730.1 hypothetical protein M514_06040 [Trichuris suis]